MYTKVIAINHKSSSKSIEQIVQELLKTGNSSLTAAGSVDFFEISLQKFGESDIFPGEVHRIKGEFGHVTLRIVDWGDKRSAVIKYGVLDEFIGDREITKTQLINMNQHTSLPPGMEIYSDYRRKYRGLGIMLMNIAIKYCKAIGVSDISTHEDLTKSRRYGYSSFYSQWGIRSEESNSLADIEPVPVTVREQYRLL